MDEIKGSYEHAEIGRFLPNWRQGIALILIHDILMLVILADVVRSIQEKISQGVHTSEKENVSDK